MTAARLIAIVGPTASGKSDLAIAAARRFGGEVISCDSVQVYRGLDIGSGKVGVCDREGIAHHLLDILNLDEEMNAARFAVRAAAAIEEVSSRGGLPIVTGGTGLYLTALLKGLFDQGRPDLVKRARLEAMVRNHGLSRMHRLLVHVDPEYAARTQPGDQVRIVRALEVFFASGLRFSAAQRERRPAFTGETLLIGLDPGREELRRRIEARVSRMLQSGLVEETRRALSSVAEGAAPPRPLGSIGYRQVVERLSEGPLAGAGDEKLQRAIVTATMQYAKRQMTYFRHQLDVEWFSEAPPALDRISAWARPEVSR